MPARAKSDAAASGAMLAAAVRIAPQGGGKATRDSYFLSSGLNAGEMLCIKVRCANGK